MKLSIILVFLLIIPSTLAINFPVLNDFITDQANIIDPEYEQQITALAKQIEQTTTVEIAIVTVQSLEGMSKEEYSATLFEKYEISENIDYLSIDTEGTELNVLKGLNFKKIKPSLLTVEDNDFDLDSSGKKEKINYMKNQGYTLINNIGVTMFFFKKEEIKQISNLFN